jgi:sugar O-acyltransferase (sialic acid O-acetyltransferase NeuD family)
MKNIIVVGASGHSKVVVDILENMGEWNIIGYIDSFKTEKEFFGYPILGTEKNIPEICKKFNIYGGIVTIGDNWTRFKMVERIQEKSPNFHFISAIHPKAILSRGVEIGTGTVVMAGVVINADTKIGNQTIINTSSLVEHDSKIGDFSTIAPKVAMGGGVEIGNFTTVSIGAIIKHYIKIEDDVVIGANSSVLKDIQKNSVAFGTPAKIVRKRARKDGYL